MRSASLAQGLFLEGNNGIKYRLIEPLGDGGMSQTWYASREDHSRPLIGPTGQPTFKTDIVALKMVNLYSPDGSRLGDFLAHEASVIRRINEKKSPEERVGFPVFLEYSEDLVHGWAFVAMRVARGLTLKRILGNEFKEGDPAGRSKKGPPLEKVEALRIALEIARALHHLHKLEKDRPRFHLDIKPDNILVEWQYHEGELYPTVTVLDPALGAYLREEEGTEGVVYGSLKYLSPEQAQSEHGNYGPHSDIYSFGCVIYRMVVGKDPFESEHGVGLIDAHASRLLPLQKIEDSNVRWLVDRMTEKNPAQRIPLFEVATFLERFIQREESPARKVA